MSLFVSKMQNADDDHDDNDNANDNNNKTLIIKKNINN